MADERDIFPDGPLELPGEPTRHAPIPKQPTRKPGKKMLTIILVILVLAALGFGIKKLFLSSSKEPAANQQTANTETVDQPEAGGMDVPDVTETQVFTADYPRIELTHPTSWKITAKDDGVRLESPAFTYQAGDGMDVEGHFRIYIRQGARTKDSEYIGRGVAIKKTEKLVYSEPAVGQREETNLSFFGLDTSDHFAYFFVAGNYELKKDDTLGPDYGTESETYIIAGGYSAPALKDDLATNKVSLDYYDQTNAYAQAMEILSSLKVL